MRIGLEFNLQAYLASDTANRSKIVEQYNPPDEVVENLKLLHQNIVAHIVDALPGELHINVAYRCNKLNAMIKGVPNSQHVKGQAVDLSYWEGGKMQNDKIIKAVKDLKLDYDQMIDENNLAWVHISYNKDGGRKMFFKL